MAAKQVKSRQRVADHGEVFTAEREVKAMCDLVKPETERIDSRFSGTSLRRGSVFDRNFAPQAGGGQAAVRQKPG